MRPWPSLQPCRPLAVASGSAVSIVTPRPSLLAVNLETSSQIKRRLHTVLQADKSNAYAELPTATILRKMEDACRLRDSNDQLKAAKAAPYSRDGLLSEEYRLSSRDFDVPFSHRQATMTHWMIGLPAAMQTREAISEVFTLYSSLVDREADCSALEQGLHLCIFADMYRHMSDAQHWIGLMRDFETLDIGWRSSPETVRLLLHLVRIKKDWIALKQLLDFSRGQRLCSNLLLEIAAILIRSPSPGHRSRAEKLALEIISAESAPKIPGGLAAALLFGSCQARSDWASLPVAFQLAERVQDWLTTTAGSTDTRTAAQNSHAWAALTLHKALTRSRTSLAEWSAELASTGRLTDAYVRDVIWTTLVRAESERFDACETEEDIRRLFSSFKDALPALGPPGTSAWGWGVRVLLGRSSTWSKATPRDPDANTRPFVDDTSSVESSLAHRPDLSPSPLQTHEANLLLDFSVSGAPGSDVGSVAPSSFMVWPLMNALLEQWPPETQRALDLYNLLLRSGSHGASAQTFATFWRRQPTHPATNHDGPDGDVIALLLKHFLSPTTGRIQMAREIMLSTIAAGHCLKIRRKDRFNTLLDFFSQYAQQYRGDSLDDDLEEMWARISQEPDVQGDLERPPGCPSTSWCGDFQPWQWYRLLACLIGENTPVVPLSFISIVLRTMHRMGVPLPSPGCRTLLWKTGHLATRVSTNPSATLISTHAPLKAPTMEDIYDVIRALHSLLASQEATSGVDTSIIGALMDAYNRVGASRRVHELWQTLVLASSRGQRPTAPATRTLEASESLPSLHQPTPSSQQVPAAAQLYINSVILSIYLDTCGWHRAESLGRRAWTYAGFADASNTHPTIRDLNAWDSWLEFLCRLGYLAEAAGPQLTAMLAACPEGPHVKTLRMLLAFGASAAEKAYGHYWLAIVQASPGGEQRQAQSQGAETSRDGKAIQPVSRRSVKAQQRGDHTVWVQLRTRIEDGEFGPEAWEQLRWVGYPPGQSKLPLEAGDR
ncbi:unnamed protein product [Parajaminaea phylloscopi]